MPLIRLLCATVLVASSAVACRDGGSSSGPSSGGTNGGTNGGGDGGGGGGGNGGRPDHPGLDRAGARGLRERRAAQRHVRARPGARRRAVLRRRRVLRRRDPTRRLPRVAAVRAGRLAHGGVLHARAGATLAEHVSVVADPADAANHALRLRSPEHTDGTVVRPTAPLPARYRISLRVGFAGVRRRQGRPERLRRGERDCGALVAAGGRHHAERLLLAHDPRRPAAAAQQHLDPPPPQGRGRLGQQLPVRGWRSGTGSSFVASGEHPVMVIALDGTQTPATSETGLPFLSYANGAWQPSGAIRAVDAYLPGPWYRVTLERAERDGGGRATRIEVSGRFASRPDEDRTYRAAIDAAAALRLALPRRRRRGGRRAGMRRMLARVLTRCATVARRRELAGVVHVRGSARELLRGRGLLRRRGPRGVARLRASPVQPRPHGRPRGLRRSSTASARSPTRAHDCEPAFVDPAAPPALYAFNFR